MYYSKLITFDVCNGDGWRVTLYVSGCKRNCPGCFNPETHNPFYGKPFTEKTKKLIFNELSKDVISGITLLGGEPMSELSDNRKDVIDLCKEIKEKFPTKTITMFTGYTVEELYKNNSTKAIFKYVDYIIDGTYIEKYKDPNLKFRGSSNQRIVKIMDRT